VSAAPYDKELRGVLFRNTAKRDGKRDADYRGHIQIAGLDYWLDAWLNTSKGGIQYLSLSAKVKAHQPGSRRTDDKATTACAPPPPVRAATPEDERLAAQAAEARRRFENPEPMSPGTASLVAALAGKLRV
jgi:hypothetical protein